MKQIPNIITLCNLLAGCLAIIFILQTGETLIVVNNGETVLNLPEKITWGAICIFIAAGIDFIDGFVARLFKASSELGKQLDSLCDVVSFGVAPGLILYQLLRLSYAQQQDGLDVNIIYLLPALLFPMLAAYRLAKFNIDTRQTYGFIGVPTPAAALVVASLPFILHFNSFNLTYIILNKWILYAIIITLGFLMISPLPLISLKIEAGGVKPNMVKFLLVFIAIVAIILLQWLAAPVILLVYILLSLVNINKAQMKNEK